MNPSTRRIGLRELLAAYLETRTPQVHPVMTDHVEKTLVAFEAALGVRVPRGVADVPEKMRVLSLLFQGTVESLLALQAPMAGALEAGLLFVKLEEAGEVGRAVIGELQAIHEQVRVLREAELGVLERLLQIFLGGARPSVTMDEVRATGLYPGDTPKDFDIFDHL